MTVLIPPMSARVFRLTKAADHPVIMGTDMHVLMGEVEIALEKWDGDAQTLTVRANRPTGESGSVFVWAPPETIVQNPAGFWIAKDMGDNSIVVRIALSFPENPDWRIECSSSGRVVDMRKVDLA